MRAIADGLARGCQSAALRVQRRLGETFGGQHVADQNQRSPLDRAGLHFADDIVERAVIFSSSGQLAR